MIIGSRQLQQYKLHKPPSIAWPKTAIEPWPMKFVDKLCVIRKHHSRACFFLVGWFQPIWNMSQIGSSPRGKNEKYLNLFHGEHLVVIRPWQSYKVSFLS